MRILITNMDGFRNKGCEASLKVIINEMERLREDVDFKIFTWDPEYDKLWIAEKENCSFLEVPYKALPSFPSAFYSKAWLFKLIGKLGLSKSIRNSIEAFQWSNAVLSTGGDVFSSTYPGFFSRLLPIMVAASYKKPVMLIGHSIGPFEKKGEYEAFKRAMRHVQLITARESISFKYLKEMKLKNTKVELTAEPAFCLEADMKSIRKILEMYNIVDKENLIGVAPSQAIASYSKTSYDSHFDILQKIIRFLIKELGCHVVLIPHVHEKSVEYDDRVICELLFRKLGFSKDVTVMSFSHSAEEIRALVSKLDFLIAERMHAAIAGLSQNVPVFVVGYSVKAEGILGDIFGFDSLDDYMISVKALDYEKLKVRVKKLFDKKDDVAKYLSKVMPRIKERARRNFTLTMEALSGNT